MSADFELREQLPFATIADVQHVREQHKQMEERMKEMQSTIDGLLKNRQCMDLKCTEYTSERQVSSYTNQIEQPEDDLITTNDNSVLNSYGLGSTHKPSDCHQVDISLGKYA